MSLSSKASAEDGTRRPGPRSKSRSVGRAVTLLVVIALGLLTGGFLLFADRVSEARQPASPVADGIVALTGGAGRIEDAVALLHRGSADRLLISGVNQQTSPDALAERGPRIADLMPCCIDIGYEALDTRGNALEIGRWARQRGYGSLIVVTSAYHMPRSLTEIARVLPEVELVPYPVSADEDGTDWRSDLRLFRLLVAEYLKFIVARLA